MTKPSFFKRMLPVLTAFSTACCILPLHPCTAAAAVSYDLKIIGKQVTDANAADILGNGVFSYDATANTLTVNGTYKTNYTRIIESGIADLVIDIAADSSLTSQSATCIYLLNDTLLTGSGALTLSSGLSCIYMEGHNLTLTNTKMRLSGNYGITGCPYSESLTVVNSEIEASCKFGAICDFPDGITLQECYVSQPADAVIQDGEICNANGSAASRVTVTLAEPPEITGQPQDVSAAVDDIAEFTVDAAGDDLIYQWQTFNAVSNKWVNTNQEGSRTATLRVTVTESSHNTKYHCIVKNKYGKKAVSGAAVLKVVPKICIQPQDVSAALGETAIFTVQATGIDLIYQWQYFNTDTGKWANTALTGNKTAALSVSAIASRNGMKYHCIVKDAEGIKLTSDTAVLQIVPAISAQPQDVSAVLGDKAVFTVNASGIGLSYQWQYFNTASGKWENTGLAGNKTASLTVSVIASRSNMKYRCVIRDSADNTVISDAAMLKILPVITAQPESITVPADSTAEFSVTASGVGLIYQWQYYNTATRKWENTNLTGSKTATLRVTAYSSRNGYKYHCIIKDANGEKITSAAATLTVA